MNLFPPLLFLFFFTLHADRLSFVLGGYTVRLNNLIGLALLLLLASRYRERCLVFDKKLCLGLGVLSGSLLLSSCASAYPARCFFFLGQHVLTLFIYVALPYLLVKLLDEKWVFKLYFRAFLCVGIYAALQLFLSLGGFQDPFAPQRITAAVVRPNAFAYEPSYYALAMTPFVVMTSLAFFVGRVSWMRLLLVNGFYFASTATSALFAYMIFLALGLFFPTVRKKIFRLTMVFALALVGFAFLFPDFSAQFFLKFFIRGTSHHSFSERWIAIENAWKIFWENPILGIGLGAIPSYLYQAWQECSDRFAYFLPGILLQETPNPLKCFEPSNVLTEIGASLGLVGLAAFGFLVWIYLKEAREALHLGDEEERYWVFLFLMGTLVSLAVLQFNQGVFRPYIWTHFTLGYALAAKVVSNHSIVSRRPSRIGVGT